MSLIDCRDLLVLAPKRQMQHGPCAGVVTLVGAGPGDPELLTVKATRALQTARLVLYDHLVSPAVLELLPADAERIYVGKESSRHTLPQASIIELMLRLSTAGRSLVRLKGGDGYIFGRGGEEAQALAAAGVPFQVIPGLTAAQGASASTGIPLTHRDHACALVLATGHLRDSSGLDMDWEMLARPRQTKPTRPRPAAGSTACAQAWRSGGASRYGGSGRRSRRRQPSAKGRLSRGNWAWVRGMA